LIFKKKFFLIIILFSFGITNVSSSEKIAYLDVEFIINKSEPALLIIEKIEKIRDQETKKLMNIENDLKKKNEELIKTKNLISEDELNKKISSLRKEARVFEEQRRKTIKDLNIKKNKELDKFLKLIKPIVQEYMKEKSIDMIIYKKNIFMAKYNKDITKDILEIINNRIN
tara:strand:+ start:1311 stop:1823 length:513 start_codon:yes stop_codon:yes gene_type:complete